MSLTDRQQKVYKKLRRIRASDTVKLKPCPLVRKEIELGVEFVIRHYQTQGIIHLLYMDRFLLGDDTGLGKTIQSLVASAYKIHKNPKLRYIVVTLKSALYQWADEIEKFTYLKGMVVRSELMFYCAICEDNYLKVDKAKHHHAKFAPKCEDCDKIYHKPTEEELETPAAYIGGDDEDEKKEEWEYVHAKCGEWKWDPERERWQGGVLLKHKKNGSGYKDWTHVTEFATRKPTYDEFFTGSDEDGPHFLILNYHTLVADWNSLIKPALEKRNERFGVTFDECQMFANPSPKMKTHKTCKDVSKHASQAVGLSATPLKNTLIDMYGVYKVLVPPLFTSKTKFMKSYCILNMKRVFTKAGAPRMIPEITGYKNLSLFKKRIDPYLLSRAKHEVAKELPELTTMLHYVEMTPLESHIYGDIRRGELEIHGVETEVNHLTALIRFQQAVDSLSVLGIDGSSGKELELVRLLSESIDGKVIVYSRLSKVVKRLQILVEAAGIKTTVIHGGVKTEQRVLNMDLFQDPDSGVDVIFITDAGSAAINLQAAATLIFYDSPWSYGKYLQILGRGQRIGSKHAKIVAIHFVAVFNLDTLHDDDRDATIDEHVLDILTPKKTLFEAVLGKTTPGALEFDEVDADRTLKNLYYAVLGL